MNEARTPAAPARRALRRAGLAFSAATSALLAASAEPQTIVTRWQHGRSAAVSLTFDDGSINQFRVAAPIMNRLRLPGTFFVITGDIPGSRYQAAFVGRPGEAILRETADSPTTAENFFERASAIGHLGYAAALEFHTRAGALFEQGRLEQAYRTIDDGYAQVRGGAFQRKPRGGFEGASEFVTWDELASLAKQGHEIGSHTVTHPRLAVLDDANLAYELEKSRQDIEQRLGPKHTFSVECPYGTENERVVKQALSRYPASRNRLHEPFLEELNRSSRADPRTSTKEYVQWQRGALIRTDVAAMKSWVDTALEHDRIWLVLVFHGVDGVGWEPKTRGELQEYFEYIESKRAQLWVATFQDVVKYMRERQHSSARHSSRGDVVEVVLRHDLDARLYDLPLTLRTRVPPDWEAVELRQGSRAERLAVAREKGGAGLASVTYLAVPNAEPIVLTRIEAAGSPSPLR
jgi:peptidoglycan/xylan/chitin deacetylase (PgdA/CDA1 family)